MNQQVTNIAQFLFNKTIFLIARLRGSFWSMFTKEMGRYVSIFSSCKIASPSGISIGNYVTVGSNSVLSGAGGLKIGNYVMIGTNCNILSSQHKYSDLNTPMMMQGVELGKVNIGDDVWIGANVVILPNVNIGCGVVIGANSVVNRDIDAFSVVGGVPARLIKKRSTA